MKGKTKKFAEDLFLLIVVVVVIFIGYYVVSNFILKEDITQVQSEKPPKIVMKIEKESENIELNTTQPIAQEKRLILDEQPQLEEQQVDEQPIEESKKTEEQKKTMNLFLNSIEEKILSNIEDIPDQNSSLSFRITVLKNGDYEQLTFVDGDEILFEKNKNNIIKIFPLTIDETIVEYFPRYVRLKIEK